MEMTMEMLSAKYVKSQSAICAVPYVTSRAALRIPLCQAWLFEAAKFGASLPVLSGLVHVTIAVSSAALTRAALTAACPRSWKPKLNILSS